MSAECEGRWLDIEGDRDLLVTTSCVSTLGTQGVKVLWATPVRGVEFVSTGDVGTSMIFILANRSRLSCLQSERKYTPSLTEV